MFSSSLCGSLVSLARSGALTDLYKRGRIQLSDQRAAPPLDPGHNFSINRWSLYAPGTTYFLPIIETTALTINALLELFSEDMAICLRDERAWFRPAGVGRFARSKGGHLHDKPQDLRTTTIQVMETALQESMATEHGMVLQNLALMTLCRPAVTQVAHEFFLLWRTCLDEILYWSIPLGWKKITEYC